MTKNVLSALYSLILLGNLILNVHARDEQKTSNVLPEGDSVIINSDKSETSINKSPSYKFEQTWIKAVNDIIVASNNMNKLDIKDSNKNTYKNTPCYTYSVDSALTPGISGGGAIYYDGGYFSFDEFKKEIFKDILRQFLSNRARYLCNKSSNSSEEREELIEIVNVLADNDFDGVVSRCVNINDLELVLI